MEGTVRCHEKEARQMMHDHILTIGSRRVEHKYADFVRVWNELGGSPLLPTKRPVIQEDNNPEAKRGKNHNGNTP